MYNMCVGMAQPATADRPDLSNWAAWIQPAGLLTRAPFLKKNGRSASMN